jgi:hypothetical protein
MSLKDLFLTEEARNRRQYEQQGREAAADAAAAHSALARACTGAERMAAEAALGEATFRQEICAIWTGEPAEKELEAGE